MIFCKKCRSLISPSVKHGKKVMICVCGYESKEQDSPLREKIKIDAVKVEVVSEEKEALPLTDVDCPRCDHSKAFYWTMQTRAADEGETKFLKCEKCKHIWRDYG